MKHFSLLHCVKGTGIRSYPGPYFPAFGPNTETFHAVFITC